MNKMWILAAVPLKTIRKQILHGVLCYLNFRCLELLNGFCCHYGCYFSDTLENVAARVGSYLNWKNAIIAATLYLCHFSAVKQHNHIVCYSVPAVERPATGSGGVFRRGNSVPVSSGGSRCVVWSPRCDTVSTWAYSAATEDSPSCHSDKRQQRAEFASTGVHWLCSISRHLDVLSAFHQLHLIHCCAHSRKRNGCYPTNQ